MQHVSLCLRNVSASTLLLSVKPLRKGQFFNSKTAAIEDAVDQAMKSHAESLANFKS